MVNIFAGDLHAPDSRIYARQSHSPFARITRNSHMRVPAGKKRTPGRKNAPCGKGCHTTPREPTPHRVTMPAPRTLTLFALVRRDGEPKNYRALLKVPAASVLNFRHVRRLIAVRGH